jgi:DNA-binding transcriptional ArsR family regulator
MLDRDFELFGGRNRTMVLLAVRLLEETYASELAVLLELRVFSVQQILASFEREGVIVSRLVGRTRVFTLNPRYFAQRELADLLWSLAKHDTVLQQLLAKRRRRPRRAGKPGLL